MKLHPHKRINPRQGLKKKSTYPFTGNCCGRGKPLL